ncbi:MAG: iron-containing alcohol dehydrogenase [Planctomycetota bacterium]|nr:iron-containing alcohol dehydrogenase [Planctomycetota bacterium]
MLAFEFHARTRFVVGEGQLARLGQLASELKAQRVLLVSDPGIIAIGHTSCAEQILRQAGIEVSVFDGVRENPTSDDVGLGCQFAHQFQPDCIIGLGGGSSMDCAKGINFVYSNGGRIQDYWGVGKASHPMLPMIAVPTTAGTGSEAQSFALISDAETHIKMACGDKKAAFQIALLDPALTLTQPARVTALTGIDALSHALESLVTRPANAISRMLSREAWRLLSMYLPRVIDEPHDLQIRGNLQWGACLAGLAIENSMLGAAHALANPLTAQYGIVHGQAIAVVLPHIVDANWETCREVYTSLCSSLECLPPLPSQSSTTQSPLAKWLQNLVSHFGLSTRLQDLQIDRSDLPNLAASAAQQWTAQFNPRQLTADDLEHLYAAAW